ncbi:MAG: T9SS type A sorting domain-containing protein [Tenuifilaceae bacterium]
MRSNKWLLFAFSLCFIKVLNASELVVSIVLSDPPVSNKLTLYTVTDPNAEAYTIQTTKEGSQCRQIPERKYAYFNVDDAAIPSTENNLIFYITFFDEGTGNANLQYNANDGSNYKSSSITKTGTNTWITATVAITNASLRNAQNNKCDFRISGAGLYLKEIAIALGVLNPENEPATTVSGSSYSEFIGKSVAGYQAWFKTGNSTSGWFHWNGTTPPSANDLSFEIYPDVTEYEEADLTNTALANLGNGSPSKLFNSVNKSVIEKHFHWMKEYGIDGVAVQRFIGNIGNAIINSPSSAALKIKEAAEANGRVFYICYDISSTGMEATWDDIIKFDWVYNVEQNNELTSSPAYAKVGNKPVVQLWGPGFTGSNRPGTAAETIALIRFLKSRGCYVIGGTPTYWRTGTRDAKGPTQPLPADQESFELVYLEYDMISPWMPGRFKDNAGADNQLITLTADKTYCDARNIKYMPVIFPGFAWSQWNDGSVNWAPRNAGDFMWHQAINIKKLGVSNMYFAMFDEYDEGTAIMKNATDWSMIPTDQYFLTSSADGIWCSSDFQLRVAGAAVEMLKGNRSVTSAVPIPYSLGPVYYRNSFEKRTTAYNYINNVAQNTGTFNLDPCFYKPAVISTVNITSPVCEIQQTNARSGLYSVKASGSISSNALASYKYKFADLKIAVKRNMKLSFWKKTENDLGRYIFIDLVTKTGKNLSNYGYKDQHENSMSPAIAHGTLGGGWEQFSCQFGDGVLLGDTITGIFIQYEHSGTGIYTAYFDDLLIEDGQELSNGLLYDNHENSVYVYPNPSNGLYNIHRNANSEFQISVYNSTGNLLINRISQKSNEIINLSQYVSGIYILRITDKSHSFFKKLIKQ